MNKVISIVKNSIAAFLGLWTIIMLSFSLVCASIPRHQQNLPDYLLKNFNNSGFSFMGFSSFLLEDGNWDWAIILLGMFSIMFLLVGIAGIMLSVLHMFNIIKTSKSITNFVIIEIVCMFLYMVFGIVITAIANSVSTYYFDYESGFKTVAFVPLIIGTIFTVAYFIAPQAINKFMIASTNDNLQKTQTPNKIHNTNTKIANIDITVELKKYKELLDSDIITKEDFDKKKAQLLDL